jgi:glycosyltransferase involved in cell wall biosynthesis
MEKQPSVSIVITTYNYGQYIKEAINSALEQTLPPCEIIVADDGSTDNTAEIVAEYGDKVRYIRYEHKGICQLRNALLDEAKGEWLLFLDADDYLATDFIEQSFRDISTGDESLAIVYPDRTYFGANEFDVVSEEFSIEKMKHRNIIVMCSLVRLSAARRIGFDLAFAEGLEDYDFFLGLINAGYKAKAQHKSHVFCRVHKRSRTAAIHKDIYRSNRLMRQIVEKYSRLLSKKEARDVLDYYNVPIAMRLHLMQLWNDKYVFIMVLYAIKYFIICLVHPWWIVGEIRRIKFLNK